MRRTAEVVLTLGALATALLYLGEGAGLFDLPGDLWWACYTVALGLLWLGVVIEMGVVLRWGLRQVMTRPGR